MVSALQRKVTQKGKNFIGTKQVQVIRHKESNSPQEPESMDLGADDNDCKRDA
jgi:hypothetical protein